MTVAPPVFDHAFRAQMVELFKWRRDVRRFLATPVPPAMIDELLRVACLAPSVGFSQPWRFVVVDDPGRRSAVRANFEICNSRALTGQASERIADYARLKLAGLSEAPCHLGIFAEPEPVEGHGLGRMTMPETTAYSVVTAAHTLWLAARASGLGVGWVSILDPAAIIAILDVPPHWLFIGYFCVGYPQAESDTPELERLAWEKKLGTAATRVQR